MPDCTHTLQLPLSKSIAARTLEISWLAKEPSSAVLSPAAREGLLCDDVQVMLDSLATLRDCRRPELYLHLSGTAMRFLTALCASLPGYTSVLHREPSLAKRPIAPLPEMLRQASGNPGVIPVSDTGGRSLIVLGSAMEGYHPSSPVTPPGSSQAISAMMLVAPYWKKGMRVTFDRQPPSEPYIAMTASLMRDWGAEVIYDSGSHTLEVKPGRYIKPDRWSGIERDWSAASFVYAALAVINSRPGNQLKTCEIFMPGLFSPDLSLQGDSRCAEIFSRFGVGTKIRPAGVTAYIHKTSRELTVNEEPLDTQEVIELDMAATPDLVPPIVVAAALTSRGLHITGVRHLRDKECNRGAALAKELAKTGIRLEVKEDSIILPGGQAAHAPAEPFETYDDHRMAMALSLTQLLFPEEVEINNHEVAGKSFPGFWHEMECLGITEK